MKMHLLSRVLLGALLVGAGGAPAWADEVDGHEYVAPATVAAQLDAAPIGVIKARSFRLNSVTAAVAQAAVDSQAQASGTESRPLQIGFGREVAALNSAAATRAQLVWQGQVDGSQATAIAITSPDAEGIRLGVRVYKLPQNVVLRVRSADGSSTFTAKGNEINDLIAANVASGDKSEGAYTWWAPEVDGQEAILEITLPKGVSQNDIDIALPKISHLYASAATDWKPQGVFANAHGTTELACHNDVTCKPEWNDQSKATAHIHYVASDGKTYQCTGTLLEDAKKSATPYFLTADHCVSTQTVASTLQSFWFHRSASCNSSTTYSGEKTVSGGADLLYRSPEISGTDTSFLKLRGALPSGVIFAGWSTAAPSDGAPATGIHSPKGDLLKISTGALSGFYRLAPPTNPLSDFSITSVPLANATHVGVNFTSGTTEFGSSGSGLFNSDKRVIGQLTGGYAGCPSPAVKQFYGRFDVAYNASLKTWLNPSVPVTCTSLGASLPNNGTNLTSQQCLRSPNGRYAFRMQSDGNAVVYDGSVPIWNTVTYGVTGRYLSFQTDGNLVVYNANRTPAWNSATYGRGATILKMQDDGNLVIYRANNSPVWSSKYGHTPFCGVGAATLSTGKTLRNGEKLVSPNSRYCFTMQPDGNAVVYDSDYTGKLTPIWNSRTNGVANRYLSFQTDGNLVVYNADRTPVWNSETYGSSGTLLKMQDDGNLVIYRANNTPVWASRYGRLY
jgi:hypothetical protein